MKPDSLKGAAGTDRAHARLLADEEVDELAAKREEELEGDEEDKE